MIDIQLFLLFLIHIKTQKKLHTYFVIVTLCTFNQPPLTSAAQPVEIEFQPTRTGIKWPDSGLKQKLQFQGRFANGGAVKRAEGPAKLMPGNDCVDSEKTSENSNEDKKRDWVAVFHLPYNHPRNQTFVNGTNCQSVLDRVKKALLFGASAVIILVLNPKILKDLDLSQLFWKPIVILQQSEDIASVIKIIKSIPQVKVKITYDASYSDIQKVTLWSMCGRPQPGSGVVCIGDSAFDKTHPASFWNYFFTLLATLMLLLLVKARGGSAEIEYDRVEQSLRRIAYQSLATMKIRRYSSASLKCNHDDSNRDTCAVCLEDFQVKQKLRVLPCFHEFHTKCVDPWLVKQRTCPLCKFNIIDHNTRFTATTGY